jgi:hypothetical protein
VADKYYLRFQHCSFAPGWKVFLCVEDLTDDEIRLLLDVLHAEYHEVQQSSYRFDAISGAELRKDQVEFIPVQESWEQFLQSLSLLEIADLVESGDHILLSGSAAGLEEAVEEFTEPDAIRHREIHSRGVRLADRIRASRRSLRRALWPHARNRRRKLNRSALNGTRKSVTYASRVGF